MHHAEGLANRPEFGLHLVEESGDARLRRVEVVEVGLLAARRLSADERAPRRHEVRALKVVLDIDAEELLLPADVAHNLRALRPDRLHDARALGADRFHRAEQRRLLVLRRAGPRDERRRNVDGVAAHEGRGEAIPRHVRRRRVRRAEAAVRERRAVRLALEEQAAAEGARLGREHRAAGGPVEVCARATEREGAKRRDILS